MKRRTKQYEVFTREDGEELELEFPIQLVKKFATRPPSANQLALPLTKSESEGARK